MILGVDPGTLYGICLYDTQRAAPVQYMAALHANVKMLKDPEALGEQISDTATKAMFQAGEVGVFAVEIAVRGPSMAVFAAQNRMIGVIIYRLKRVAPVVEVNPRHSKKALTGNGNAKKNGMVAAADRLYPEHMLGTKAEREAKADALAHVLASLKYNLRVTR